MPDGGGFPTNMSERINSFYPKKQLKPYIVFQKLNMFLRYQTKNDFR
jgi:hypothetical protein